MAPRRGSKQIQSTGATSSKASPLPDWVKKGGKPPPPAAPSREQDTGSRGKKGAPSTNGKANANDASTANAQPERPPRPPPLFPPGTKTPQNLLNERVQKLFKDWNRPDYHPRPRDKGNSERSPANEAGEDGQEWTCSVNLSRPNPKDRSHVDIVRMVPDELDERQRFAQGQVMSKEMARHFGATYALFRLFSNQSLGLMLPKQFRDYWSALEAWKKSVSTEQQSILFASDPFQAQAQLQIEKEARAAKRERERMIAEGDVRSNGQSDEKLPKRWKEAREVRMSKAMRDWVEEIVRTASAQLGDLEEESGPPNASSSSRPNEDVDERHLHSQLSQLGFRPGYVSSAIPWLQRARAKLASSAQASQLDPLLQSIATQSNLEAALTYLTLYVPEEDLPPRFKAGASSEGFVTAGVAKGKEDALKLQWALDRLTKVAGFPKAAATQAILDSSESEVGLREMDALRQLLSSLSPQPSATGINSGVTSDCLERRRDELTVVQSILGEERVLAIPQEERPLGFGATLEDCFDVIIAGPFRAKIERSKQPGEWGKEDIRLRCLWKHDHYPSEESPDSWPTFYAVSDSRSGSSEALPAFMRLALTQRLLRRFADAEDWKQMLSDGQGGLIMAMVEELESCWKSIVQGGAVKFEEVMSGLVGPRPHSASASASSSRPESPMSATKASRNGGKQANFRPARAIKKDAGLDATLFTAQRSFQESPRGIELVRARQTLPIAHHYASIVSTLLQHRLILLTGSTGSGKTTQLPQFILDSEIEAKRGSECKIIVTQPRRVSAMSIAERVAHERGETTADTVGWAVRGERKVGKTNRILFTTTGLLLRRLQTEPDLASISHLLIDEIHERSLDSDLLLLEVVTLLRLNPRLKVVLMSATLSKDKFVRYFAGKIGSASKGSSADIGSIDVEGRIHPVDDFYLEDLVNETGFRPSTSSPASWAASRDKMGPLKGLRGDLSNQGFSEASITALEILERERKDQGVGPLDYELVGRAVQHVVGREQRKEKETGDSHLGAILVFMSGVGEIRQACEAIRSTLSGASIEVMPLHSNLTNEEQQGVFKPTRAGVRKIVVATNVAEASITIDGITAVIDSGRVKETSYDPESGLTRLVEKYTSQASAMQRRGRAGRTRRGECWKLFTRTLERRKMPQDSQPEMTRVPLESVILHVLSMNKSDVTAYLTGALDPPSLTSISSAINNLLEAGAVRRLESSPAIATTALGRHLANLPLDLRLGKLLILGCLFQCLGPLLTVAAIMSCKPLFAIPFERRDELTAVREKMAASRKSDLLTDAAFFDEWASMRKQGNASNAQVKQFVSDHHLSPSTLRDVASTRLDLLSDLQELGFAPRDYKSYSGHDLDAHAGESTILRALLAASLWPNLVRVALPATKFAESSGGAIAKDPEARQVKFFDESGRVFLHPSSVLFSQAKFDASPCLAVFRKSSNGVGEGAKVYLRDATEVPTYALLLLCGQLKVHHLQGGISIGRAGQDSGAEGGGGAVTNPSSDGSEGMVRLRAPARIGVLSAQLRRLLDAHLGRAFEGDADTDNAGAAVVEVFRALLDRDGMSAGTLAA
ncbi:unnamed protein product [Parajaminaea phylloscopi]